VYLNEEKIMSDARRYFLGKMAEGERVSFEAEFIANGDAFELVRVSEDELVEEYVRGLLPSDARRLFESRYLVNEANKRKVEFTRSLISTVTTTHTANERSSFLEAISAFFYQNKLAFGSALGLVLILGAIWLFLPREAGPEIAREMPPVNSIPPVSDPTPVSTISNSLNTDTGSPRPSPPKDDNRSVEKLPETPTRTPILALFAGTLRSGGSMPTAVIDNNVKTVSLSLNLESREYERYRAEIVDPDGNVVYRSGTLTPNGKKISMSFPTAQVKSGEYSVRLSGLKGNATESAADFSFRVTRK